MSFQGLRFFLIISAACIAMNTANGSESCRNDFEYAIYFGGIRTGEMHRTETLYDRKGVVESYSRASILGIGTEYQQKAEFVRLPDGTYLTHHFHQTVSGFRSRDMTAEFSATGSQSEVNLNGEVSHYDNKGQPLRDVDTLALQLRAWVMQGQDSFSITRQASDGPEPYDYEVRPKQEMTFSRWGRLEVIPVEQTGAETITYWLAPELDYHLVKATYHGLLLNGGLKLKSMTLRCDA